jgi:hypothetical protein
MTDPRRQPWLKWYPSDWRAEPGLRMCGWAARGLWIDMLGLMHEAEPYGHLVINGNAPTPKQLAMLLGGGSPRDVERLLAELEGAGVFSRTPDGTVYSRRMVRDRGRAQEGRDWANKRWANGEEDGSPNKDPNGSPNGSPTDLPITQKLDARSQMPESFSLRSNDGDPPPDLAALAVTEWNTLAQRIGLPSVQRLTPQRKAKLSKRLSDAGGIEGWRLALAKLEANRWMHGDNDRGWKAGFDFLLQESSFTKLMEGAYDRSSSNGPGAGGAKHSNGFAAVLAEGGGDDTDRDSLFRR